MPCVSVVTATYNRSNVLRHAIESVRRQTLEDWELLVIGDHCTDDTAVVVASFGDARIRFVNLPHNHGEQSAANNAGLSIATGDYVAFLNHDDVWFPDHLSTLVSAIVREQADLVYALSARIDASGTAHLWGHSPGGRYAPWHSVPASVWLMRRDLSARVGPWRPGTGLFDAPSQEWLRRALASGARLQPVSRITAVQVTSGGRRDSYSHRDEREQAEAIRAITDDPAGYRERLLTAIAQASSSAETYTRPLALAGRTVKAAIARACVAVGLPPVVFFSAVRHGRRGGFIRSLRRTRGLPPAFGERRA
jgi:glycosyltransferase involved in cell wall biosynthesis